MVIYAQEVEAFPRPCPSLDLEWSSPIATLRGRPLDANSERWIWERRVGGEVRQRVAWCWDLVPFVRMSFPTNPNSILRVCPDMSPLTPLTLEPFSMAIIKALLQRTQ